jgi:hypothetical protein
MKQSENRGVRGRSLRWLVSAEGVAAAAAAIGELSPLLALEVWRRGDPAVNERPRQVNGVDAGDAVPGAVRPGEAEKPTASSPTNDGSD